MIKTDDVIRKIQHQATLALDETSQKRKEAYLYSIHTLTELVIEGEDAADLPKVSPEITKGIIQDDALELKKMMGDMYASSAKTKEQTKEGNEDRFEQGSGSLLDF